MKHTQCTLSVVWVAFWVLLGPRMVSCQAEWATYRGDAQRTASTAVDLPAEPQLLWSYRALAPASAWPPPARRSYWQRLESIEPRVTEDRVFHPVAVGYLVFWGSSTDDQIRCLDLTTGETRWSFAAGGPIRFAPWVTGYSVLFGCDDGRLYALSAETGSVQWIRSVAPRALSAERHLHSDQNERQHSSDSNSEKRGASSEDSPNGLLINGNGRLISPWPVRTGVVVEDSTVYVAAGLFPTQGTWAAAFDVATGELRWRVPLPDISPQGYLLLSRDRLFIPNGRSTPVSIARSNGLGMKGYPGVGGSYAVLVDDLLFAGRGNDGTLVGNTQQTADQLVQLKGRQMVVSNTHAYIITDTHLLAMDRIRQIKALQQRPVLQKQREELQNRLRKLDGQAPEQTKLQAAIQNVDNQLEANQKDLDNVQLWQVPCDLSESLLLAGEHLVAGGAGAVAIYSTRNGELLWRTEVSGQAGGLAVHNEKLIVSTTEGDLLVFGNKESQPGQVQIQQQPVAVKPTSEEFKPETDFPGWNQRSTQVTEILEILNREVETIDGFCLVLGIGDGELCKRAAEETSLRIVVLDQDRQRVQALRQAAAGQRLPGSKLSVVAVVQAAAGEIWLPISDYLASAIVLHDRKAGEWSEASLQRVLRPFGGVLIEVAEEANRPEESDIRVTRRGPLEGAGSWRHLYGTPANTATSGDQRMRRDLRLQWFGTLGPRDMVDRHLRGPAPLAEAGRMYVFGENKLFGLDAYSGLVQWELDLPASQRYSIPYDAGYAAISQGSLYVAVNDQMWVIDGNRGEVKSRVSNPGQADQHWGYLAELEGWIIGSLQQPQASRTEASRRLADLDYRSGQGVVLSESLFAFPVDAEQPRWIHNENTMILNPTITADAGAIYFVQIYPQDAAAKKISRASLKSLQNLPAELVCLNLQDGKVKWRTKLDMTPYENIMYLLAADNRLVLTGTRDATSRTATYRIIVYDAERGTVAWTREHEGRRGDLGHGEQVQHPVVIGTRLISEPYLFNLHTGEMLQPDGEPGDWSFTRPGHSCGTITGAGECLFFRANTPVRLYLGNVESEADRFERLAPSRTGCWINAIPAQGLLLIPEASAGCVCNYPLQTSMGFLPVESQPEPE